MKVNEAYNGCIFGKHFVIVYSIQMANLSFWNCIAYTIDLFEETQKGQ